MMLFCHKYLYAVQWESHQSWQGYYSCTPRTGGWLQHRTRWGKAKGAMRFRTKLLRKARKSPIRNVQVVRRPVGAVEVWLP